MSVWFGRQAARPVCVFCAEYACHCGTRLGMRVCKPAERLGLQPDLLLLLMCVFAGGLDTCAPVRPYTVCCTKAHKCRKARKCLHGACEMQPPK